MTRHPTSPVRRRQENEHDDGPLDGGPGRRPAGGGVPVSDPLGPPAVPAPSAVPTTSATVDDLVAGLIAAHDLASASGPDGGEGGVAVQVQLERTLRGAGIDRVAVTGGDVFDPAFHLAVATEAAPRPDLDRRIAREVRAGWMSAAGILRPAEVVVFMTGTTQ